MDTTIKLVDSLAGLLKVLIWPAICIFLVIRFQSEIGRFLSNLGEFTLKGAGFEASLKPKKQEITDNLTAATLSRPDANANPEATARDIAAIHQVVAEGTTPEVIRKTRRSTLLWVDDRPDNNRYERQALEALGIVITISTSTEDALAKFQTQHFDVIISDMGRPPDPRAGYTLLDKLRATGDKTPFIIYAGSRALQHRGEAKERGALDCTNRPDELFELVLRSLS